MATATLETAADPTVAQVAPTKEIVVGLGYADLLGGYGSQASKLKDVTDCGGWRLAELQLTDEKISSSIRTVKQGVLRQGMQITAMIDLDAEEDPGGIKAADVKQAIDVEDHCQRSWQGMQTPGLDFLDRMQDAWAFRTTLAERVCRLGTEGPDKGLYVLDKLKPLHPASWALVLDALGNVRGVRAPTVDSTAKILPADHFCRLAVFPRHWSPLGQGLLAEAYNPWNMKIQLMTLLWKYLQLFALPTIKAILPEGAKPRKRRNPDGEEYGEEVPAVVAWASELMKIITSGGRMVTLPFGADFNFLEPAGDGAVFHNALDMLDRMIVYAIQQTTRASMESTRSSRTDAATGQDLLGLLISYGKRILAEMVTEQIFRPLLRLNFGDTVAEKFTPAVSFGEIDPDDFSRNAGAIAKLASVGLLTPDDRSWYFKFLGINSRRSRNSNNQKTQPVNPNRPVVVRQPARAA